MKTTVWNQEIGDHTAQLLFETESYLVDFQRKREDWFVWKSGIRAPCYCNCRYLNRSYLAYEACTAYIETIIRLKFPETQIVVGLASAGVSWAARIATRMTLPMAFIRGTPKGYGVGQLVEGNPERNLKAVIIDDLCGSGDTILKGIEALDWEFQIKTLGFITITNWCFESMWKKFEPLNLGGIYSLTSYPNILKVGVRLGHLTQEQADMLEEFYKAPRAYDWPLLKETKEEGEK
jgi:orotate phosphoribosyltransferase